MPKTFFERFIVIEADFMFDGAGTPKLIRLKCKDVMVGEEQLPHYGSIMGRPLTQAIEVQLIHQLFLLLLYRTFVLEVLPHLQLVLMAPLLEVPTLLIQHALCMHTLLEKDGTVSHVSHHYQILKNAYYQP